MQTDVSNIDIAVFALWRLGGHQRKVHTEEVAYEAFCLAQERFGWRLPRFRDMGFPDKEPVRSALMDARKAKYGRLVTGRAGEAKGRKELDGWMLTAAGVAWAQKSATRIKQVLNADRPSTRPNEAARFRKRLHGEPLFQAWRQGKALSDQSRYQFTDMLDTAPDAPTEMVAAKFARLQSMAEMAADAQVIEFLRACKRSFAALLGQNEVTEGD